MSRTRFVLVAVGLVVALAACSGSSSPSASGGGSGSSSGPVASASEPAESMAASNLPPESAEPSESAMASEPESAEPSLASAVPTDIDPCTLVTADEAKTLSGVDLGKGKKSTMENNGNLCVYASTTAVVNVEVLQAPDQATVDAAKQQALAELKQGVGKGITVTQLDGIGDAAAEMTGSGKVNGVTLSAIGLYLLKGTVFVGFSDVGIGTPVASDAAMQAQAQTILGRLP
jgi:hypothetical protein